MSAVQLFLFLPKHEIDLSPAYRLAFLRSLQIHAISVKLIDAVNEYNNCQTLVDVALGPHTDRELLGFVRWNRDVGLNDAISVGSSDFFEGSPLWPEDLACNVSQRGHCDREPRATVAPRLNEVERR